MYQRSRMALVGAGLGIVLTSGIALAAPADKNTTALQLGGRGTQIYVCQEIQTNYGWALEGPSARLYDASGQVVGKHFFGPEWQANDGSEIKGKLLVASMAPGGRADAPWLVLRAQVLKANGIFAQIKFVVRTNTKGGGVPNTTCGSGQNGQTAAIPYTATYTFFSSPSASP
jgi:hypothetical protein